MTVTVLIINLFIHQTGAIFRHLQVSEILKFKTMIDEHHPRQDAFNLVQTSQHLLALLYIYGGLHAHKQLYSHAPCTHMQRKTYA